MTQNLTRFQARLGRSVLFSVIFLVITHFATAEEGMWTYDNLPIKQLKEKYNFTPTQEWLDHVRLSSVRFNDGGSGSFVSPNGLVLTNHHVASGQLQKVSTPEKNYLEKGFYAQSQDEEIKCSDLVLNVLVSMENVTDKVLSAVQKDMSGEEALKARKSVIAEIEKSNADGKDIKADVVSLYNGGEYWLYKYKRYTDVRIVMAPERQIAFFGGDDDNFTFPRWNLDFAIFRVYENGKPVKSNNYLKWNTKGASADELVFTSGHPGSTERLNTYDQLVFSRDFMLPITLKHIQTLLDIYNNYSKKGTEEARRALSTIFGLENSKKALTGRYLGLLNEGIMATKKRQEDEFRSMVDNNPEWKSEFSPAWKAIDEVIENQKPNIKERFAASVRGSKLYGIAERIIRFVVESKKANGERLPGYYESQLEDTKFYLLSPAPIYKDLEEEVMSALLKNSAESLGNDHEFMKMVLNGRSIDEAVKDLVTNTRVNDIAFRKQLIEGGEEFVRKSDDPMIQLAWKLDPMMRARVEWEKKNVESILTPATEKIARARFVAYGKNLYPDATFTLRISYGTAKDYPMNGTLAPFKTTVYGLYDRAASFDGKYPFNLPERFAENKDKFDMSTPVNFVTTNDIIGGNSGSPVVNRKAEFVGLVFDGNIESLVGEYVYDMTANRCVAVHPAFIIESMRKLYGAGKLADELEGK